SANRKARAVTPDRNCSSVRGVSAASAFTPASCRSARPGRTGGPACRMSKPPSMSIPGRRFRAGTGGGNARCRAALTGLVVDSSPVMMRHRHLRGHRMIDGFVALYIFMLAAIAGHVIISRVPVILHTPLMSGSNFIHGIVLIGAMVVLGHAETNLEKVIGFIAVLMGAGNAAGGYVVTERMLEMFRSSKKP